MLDRGDQRLQGGGREVCGANEDGLREVYGTLRMEFREFKVEAAKSSDAKSETLFLRLVVTLSGASLLLGPMILAGYELISGRILFRGNR